jgi:hypothetical protein
MNDFENYDVRAWTDDGLTHHLKVIRRVLGSAIRKRMPSNLRAVAAAGTAAALLGIASSAVSMAPQYEDRFVASPHRVAVSRVDNARAATFWRSVRMEVRQWKRLNEVDLAEPPELI